MRSENSQIDEHLRHRSELKSWHCRYGIRISLVNPLVQAIPEPLENPIFSSLTCRLVDAVGDKSGRSSRSSELMPVMIVSMLARCAKGIACRITRRDLCGIQRVDGAPAEAFNQAPRRQPETGVRRAAALTVVLFGGLNRDCVRCLAVNRVVADRQLRISHA